MPRTLLVPIASALLFLSLGAAAAQPTPAARSTAAAKPMAAHSAAQPMAANFASQSALAKTAAEHCRDNKGKFVSCEKKAEPKRCRDAQGKFTACPK